MNFKNPPLDSLAWKKPDTEEKHLDDLVAAGLLPKKAFGHWRALEDDEYLGVGGQEIILFRVFCTEGIRIANLQILLLSAALLWSNGKPPDTKWHSPHFNLCPSLQSIYWDLSIFPALLSLFLGQMPSK
jgi:hypothetical protein